jgi:hypothetical protein
VKERIDLVALEQLPHLGAVADVGLDELVLRPAAGRRAEIDVDDLLGLLAAGELVGQPAADVTGAACDQVPHGRHPIPGRPASVCERSLNIGPLRDFRRIARKLRVSATSGAKSC